MLYALLKLVHLYTVVIWVGGMVFALFCLRPAALGLPPPTRVPLMHTALGRFFKLVLVSSVLTLLSGGWMMSRVAQTTHQTGAKFNMPLEWMAMAVGGVLMVAIFMHIRFALFKRLTHAVAAQDWPAGGAALGSIRTWVGVNLALGTLIVTAVVLGTMS
ncbi:MAG TPA: CopD family protein [Rhizobacter sp.]|nr:CopD family protein [Rhizobacter sp.]